MKYSEILVKGATGGTGSTVADQRLATATAETHEIPSAQAWFAGGERVSYDPKARAIVGAQGAPLNVFLKLEGDLTHAVSFLPGFRMAHLDGPRFSRTCRTPPRCPSFSSSTLAW
jgi:hypothetical protein